VVLVPCHPLHPSLEMLRSPSPGGRGHQVHKSWPTTISESNSSLDPSPGSGEWVVGRLGWVAAALPGRVKEFPIVLPGLARQV
jgi:hypothetical protein